MWPAFDQLLKADSTEVRDRVSTAAAAALAGCGQTACWIAGMRFPERRSAENRRFSCLEKVAEDFFHE
jgi:hypothetical protein